MVEILGQFNDGALAVTHALQLVIAYILQINNQEAREELASKYAPNVLHRKTTRKRPHAVVVFDIDDTLLFDVQTESRKLVPHQVVVDLLWRLQQLGADIHLVTARLHDAEYKKETERELASLGITHYASLTLAPEKARTSMAAVSKWKMMTRRKIAAETRSPVTLTVGDQWGDMVVLEDDDHIDTLDTMFKANTLPYIVLRPHDQVSLWGLKLPAYS